MKVEDGHAVVRADRGGSEQTLTAQLVIAADGAASSFSQGVGIEKGRAICAVRAYVSADDQYLELADFHFFAECLPLYCWGFPVEPGLCNVGLAAPSRAGRRLAELLRNSLLQQPALRERLGHAQIVSPIRGGILRSGFHPKAATRERLLVAGDVASLVSPLTGEGIKQAVTSGEIAAQCALRVLETGKFTQSELAPYGSSLRRLFAKRFRQLALLNAIIQIPGIMNRLVRA